MRACLIGHVIGDADEHKEIMIEVDVHPLRT
jgi:hypothetical protein